MTIPREHQRYTYKDFLAFPEGDCSELIDGKIFSMTPAPSRIHMLFKDLTVDFATLLKE